MAEIKSSVHVQFGFDFGPASRFVPPQTQISQKPDPGGGQPNEPNALSFIDADGEIHVYVVSDETKRKLVEKLTGGIVMPDGGLITPDGAT